MIEEEELGLAIGEYVSAYKGQLDISIVRFGVDGFALRFSGALCKRCGPEDYVEGFAYLLKLKGINVKLINYKEDAGTFLVEYSF